MRLIKFICQKCNMPLGEFTPSAQVEHKRCGTVTKLTKAEQEAARE